MVEYDVVSVKPYFYINRIWHVPTSTSTSIPAKMRAGIIVTYKKTATTTAEVWLFYTTTDSAINRQWNTGTVLFSKPLSQLSDDMALIKDMNERSAFSSQLKVRFNPSNVDSMGICTFIGEYDFQPQLKKPTKKKTTAKKKSVTKKKIKPELLP